jgi:hypothetical protein
MPFNLMTVGPPAPPRSDHRRSTQLAAASLLVNLGGWGSTILLMRSHGALLYSAPGRLLASPEGGLTILVTSLVLACMSVSEARRQRRSLALPTVALALAVLAVLVVAAGFALLIYAFSQWHGDI